ncbi:MAG TPA: hypothetical protein VHQ86_01495 [Candidatus Saccharimonadia bacterium]|nr:hypothetical protein [Candidatus Saccharimonadia bacterium]
MKQNDDGTVVVTNDHPVSRQVTFAIRRAIAIRGGDGVCLEHLHSSPRDGSSR